VTFLLQSATEACLEFKIPANKGQW